MANITVVMILCFALFLMLLAAGATVCMAVWVYRDAKSRGQEAWVWTLVVVLVPSFIGLLLYFLVGRKETKRPCPGCGKQVPLRSTFCGYCGANLPQGEEAKPTKPVGKGLLIAAIAGVVLTVVLGVAGIVTMMVRDGFDWKPTVSTVYMENSWGDSWSVKWHYTNKTAHDTFSIDDDGPRTLYFEGECENGPLTLRVYQGDTQRTFDLSGGEEVEDSLDLSIFHPGKVYLELDNNDGQGEMVEFEARWE